MNSVSPVLTESEIEAERVIALDQKQYFPVISLRISYNDKDGNPTGNIATLTRFRFSDKEREAIANGADMIISQPHHDSLMPIGLQLAFKDSYPMEEHWL